MTRVLPSDTVKNPKLNTNSTSSARSYPTGDPQSSSNSFKTVNAIQSCFKPIIKDKKDQLQVNTLTVNEFETPILKEPKKTLEDEFADLHLNRSVLEVLAHVPMYDALLDKHIVSLELGKNGSGYIQSVAPERIKDPDLFILPCRLGDSQPFDTLADLGSCVNLLLLKLFKELKVGLLEETDDVLGLADGTKSYPIYETEVKGSSSSNQNSQNVAFVSSNNSGSSNQAHGSNSANTDSMSDAVIYSFFANQSNSPQLDNEDLQQIDADDLEEMDLKWQMAMLTIRAIRFLNKTGRKISANGFETIGFNKSKEKRGFFIRECRAPRENRNREPVRRNVIVETTETKALVAQDGLRYDWSDQAKEGPTNFALMAYTSSGSSSSSSSYSEISTCSKACLKSYESLKEHYDNLTKDFNKSRLNVGSYKAGLESVEARLDVYKMNEVVFEEDIKILKFDIMLRDNALTELRKKFEKAEKERDDLKLTLEKFENSSKNLSKLLEIQVSDKFKTGVGYDSQVVDSQVFDSQVNDKYKTGEGYHAVPPPYTGNFMPPKPNLVLADEEEYVFSESITSVPAVATSKVKTSESKPKSVSEPLIEDCISDNEDENEIEFKSKQQKKTVLLSRKPALSFMRPFGCPVTILNTIDHLGKFDGKADEGFFVGYSTNSKAFRVFNSRTRIVEENLHVKFSEETPNIVGNGPNWLFDIDALTKSMNYEPVVAGNQSNGIAGTKACENAGKARVETVPGKDYILLPFLTQDPPFSSSSKDSPDAGFKPSGEEEKKDAEQLENEDSEVSNTEEPRVNQEQYEFSAIEDQPQRFSKLSICMFLITSRAQKGNRSIKRSKLDRSYARRASTVQVTTSLDLWWDLHMAKEPLSSNGVPNKKDERGIVVRNKARLVAQGYTQEDGIDYDEVFAPVARIEAIRLFLAYASFKDFVVYQMDVKSTFLYGKIEEEVYVFRPLGFEDPEFPDKVYKVEKALYGLHQAPRAWYETLSTYLLENGFQRGTIDKTLFIKKVKGDILLFQVYVDDINFESTKKELCTEFEKLMHKKF
ncbi:retrovirus-related pol polyprotein from transposon TNT 1-94 [Tanacetum coccineum]